MGAKGVGKTPGSGRVKGVKNKNSIKCEQLAEELGINPFKILLYYAVGDWKALRYESEFNIKKNQYGESKEFTITPEVRARAAGEACHYLYPKLKAIEHSGSITNDTDKETIQVILTLPRNGSEEI